MTLVMTQRIYHRALAGVGTISLAVDPVTEVQRLRDRIKELEEILGTKADFVGSFRCERGIKEFLGLFTKRREWPYAAIYTVLWGAKSECDQPQSNIIGVYACKARKALQPYGIKLYTRYSCGYYVTAEGQQKLQALVRGEKQNEHVV